MSGQAPKSWKARLAAGLLCLLPLPAAAAPSPALVDAVQAMLDTALGEQKIFLNCLATTEDFETIFGKNWRDDSAAAVTILTEAGFPKALIDDFAARAKLEALLMSDAPFAEVIAFCKANPGWQAKMYRLQYVLLPFALPKLLEDGVPPPDGARKSH
jgi:hypothetical protein